MISSKKYKVIVKVGNDKFVKYHATNLLTFTSFLDSKFPEWRWYNIYDKSGNQIGSFTRKNRPTSKFI